MTVETLRETIPGAKGDAVNNDLVMTGHELRRQVRQMDNECIAELAKGEDADLRSVANLQRQIADLMDAEIPKVEAARERRDALFRAAYENRMRRA